MESTDVVIAGGGPTGLMLACELRRAGVAVLVVDRLPMRTGESRAGGLHIRSMELLDQRGMLDGLASVGQIVPAGHFAGLPLAFDDLFSRYPFYLSVIQPVVEQHLEEHAATLGVGVEWAAPVVGFAQDGEGVTVEIDRTCGRRQVRAAYLVGCDGGHSSVRKLAGIGFPGTPATMAGILGDVELADPPDELFFGVRRGVGDFSVAQFEPGWHRVIVQRHDVVHARDFEPSVDDFRRDLLEVAGTDYGMHRPRWVSKFGDAARLADRYRTGRVFLAGDAAHVHHPAGGQGVNLGVQDAANLGWKLAAVLGGNADEDLLDTYESERRPIAERVLHNTRAQTALSRAGEHVDALREFVTDIFGIDDVRRRVANMITGLDIEYETRCAHPMAGRRMPDLELCVEGRRVRVAELMRTAGPKLLVLEGLSIAAGNRWSGVEVVVARLVPQDPRIVGDHPPVLPQALLIRPDGYVAWAGDLAALGVLSAAEVPGWAPRRDEPARKGIGMGESSEPTAMVEMGAAAPRFDTPEVAVAIVSVWAVLGGASGADLADVADEIARSWLHPPRPADLVSVSCFVGLDGTSVLVYEQWASEAAAMRSLTVPGLDNERRSLVRRQAYRIHRTVPGADPAAASIDVGCYPVVFQDVAPEESARAVIDEMLAAEARQSGPTPAYPGCVAAHMHASCDDDAILVLAEWESVAAHRAHFDEVWRDVVDSGDGSGAAERPGGGLAYFRHHATRGGSEREGARA